MTAGRVSVNGVVETSLGTKVRPVSDVVEVDGRRVSLSDSRFYAVLNKPPGYVTTMSDPHDRPTVASLLPISEHPGLFPVGRLDLDTTGVLLFTTDGELAHRLLHPKWKVPKTYEALVDGRLDAAGAGALREGVHLDDGMTAPAEVRVLEDRRDRTLVEIVISEGRKRQVKRMFQAVGHPVLSLHRVRFGPIALSDLPEGEYRELTPEEIARLRRAVAMEDE